MSNTDGAANVSLVSPDGGSLSPIPPAAGDDGTRAVDSFDDRYSDRIDAEAELDEKLSSLYDKLTSEDEDTGQQTQPATEGRQRDPVTGKFVGAQPAPDQAGQSQTKAEEQPPATTGQAGIPVPQSWPAEKKALWDTLSHEHRDFLAQREQHVVRALTQQGQALHAYRPIGNVIIDNKDLFEAHGAPPAEGVKALLGFQRFLDSDPVRAIGAIAERYGVDLAKHFGAGAAAAEGDGSREPASPRVAQLEATVAELRAALAQTGTRLDQRDNAERQAAVAHRARLEAAARGHVESFGAEKPHFAAVRGVMKAILESGEADSLDEAYEMAIHAKPAVRQALFVENARKTLAARKAIEDKAKAEDAQHASEAKRSQRIQVGGGSRFTRPAAANGKWNDDDYLSSAYDRAASRS